MFLLIFIFIEPTFSAKDFSIFYKNWTIIFSYFISVIL